MSRSCDSEGRHKACTATITEGAHRSLATRSIPRSLTNAENLDQLSRCLILLVLSGHYEDPAISRYFSPIIEADWHGTSTTTGLPAFLAVSGALVLSNLSKVHGIVSSFVAAKEGKRTATAWLTTTTHLSPMDHVGLETVIKLDWQLGGKGWLCVKLTGIRAPALVEIFQLST